MAWTSPRTWSIAEFVTKAILDTHIRDNFIFLKQAKVEHPYGDNRHIESGSQSVSLAPAAWNGGVTVTFTDSYVSAPIVTVSFENQTDAGANTTGGTGPPAAAWVASVTATNFVLFIRNNSNSNPSTIVARWIAIGID